MEQGTDTNQRNEPPKRSVTSRYPVLVIVAIIFVAILTAGLTWWAIQDREDKTLPPIKATTLQPQQWEIAANTASVPRTEVSAAMFGTEMFVVGGFDAAGKALDTVELYNPETGVWTTGPSLPSAIHHTAAVAFNGQLYVVGGLTGSDFAPTKNVWIFDGEQWQAGPSLPEPIGAQGTTVLNGRLYIVGGSQAIGKSTAAMYSLGAGEKSWRTEPPMTTARNHLTAASTGDKLYAIGGRDDVTSTMQTTEIFDPATNTWQAGPDMPTGRSGIASAVVGGNIYVFGGESTEKTFNEAEAYNPATNTWRSITPMPEARHGLGASTFNNKIFLFLGGPQPGLTVSDNVQILQFEEE